MEDYIQYVKDLLQKRNFEEFFLNQLRPKYPIVFTVVWKGSNEFEFIYKIGLENQK